MRGLTYDDNVLDEDFCAGGHSDISSCCQIDVGFFKPLVASVGDVLHLFPLVAALMKCRQRCVQTGL